MDIFEVMEKRRTIRDFSDKEVSDEMVEKILSTAFLAPTNDHLRQFEFVVVRGQENIAKFIAPVKKNTTEFQQTAIDAATGIMDKDEHDMFVDALPKQQRMLIQSNCLILPFFRQGGPKLLEPTEQQSLNYFASAWCALENIFLAATAEGLGCAFRIPIVDEAEHVKALVGAPADYEMPCFLAIGYPAEKQPTFKQKIINVKDRIHFGKW